MITKLLTRERAIELCIEMWTWLAKTGLTKEQWPRWPELIAFYGGEVWGHCWFCEYDNQEAGEHFENSHNCESCPLKITYGGCSHTAYDKWDDSLTMEERKIYAAEFLDEIKAVEIVPNVYERLW